MRLRTTIGLMLYFVSVLTVWTSLGDAQVVTRGPYLQLGTETGIVVRWRTDVATDSRVRYGTTIGAIDGVATNATSTTEHSITLTALGSNTKYYYSVGTSTQVLVGNNASHYFRTSPTRGSTRAVRVWVIGDSGMANQGAGRVRNGYRNYPASAATDVWLMLGDNAYESGTDAEYEAGVFDMYPTILRCTLLWPTRGNHDQIYSGLNNDYYDAFSLPTAGQAGGLASGTEAYYAFDFANVHFICLDSQGSDRTAGGAMLTWLAQDLAATAQDWIIAYWHHPPYSKGSHDSDTETQLIEMRQNALPILEAGGVDLVLTGHSHAYERSFLLDGHYGSSSTLVGSMKVDAGDGQSNGDGVYSKPTVGPGVHEGAVYAVAGSSATIGGGPLNHPVMITSLNRLGSMVLDINHHMLEAAFIDSAGTEWDSFAIVKGGVTSVGGNTPPASGAHLSVGRPNPFGEYTDLDYSVPVSGQVKLMVYDVSGHRVRSLFDGYRGVGMSATRWDGRDDQGHAVPQGVYFAVLRVAGEKRTQRVVVLR